MTYRPWTVYVLVAASLGGLAFGLVIDSERTLWDAVSVAITLAVAWGFWTARAWAFSMSFMLASLCLALALGVAFVQSFLFEMPLAAPLLPTAAVSALWVALLLHPATKTFAGLTPRRRELQS